MLSAQQLCNIVEDKLISRSHRHSGSEEYTLVQCPNTQSHANGDRHPSLSIWKKPSIPRVHCFGACSIKHYTIYQFIKYTQDVLGLFKNETDLSQVGFDPDLFLTQRVSILDEIKENPYDLLYMKDNFRRAVIGGISNKWQISKDVWKSEFLHIDEARKNVVFPIFSNKHKIVGVIGRSYLPSSRGPKYFSYHKNRFNKSYYLYGEYNIDPSKFTIIVEGIRGRLNLLSKGFGNKYNILSALGNKLSYMQLIKLDCLLSWTKIFVFPDGDQGGVSLSKGLNILNQMVYTIEPDKGKDPRDYLNEEIEKKIKYASPLNSLNTMYGKHKYDPDI